MCLGPAWQAFVAGAAARQPLPALLMLLLVSYGKHRNHCTLGCQPLVSVTLRLASEAACTL